MPSILSALNSESASLNTYQTLQDGALSSFDAAGVYNILQVLDEARCRDLALEVYNGTSTLSSAALP